jgi:hypothetical protein
MHYRCDRVGEAIDCRCTFIGQFIQRYLNHATYERPELKYAQQSSSVEGLRIYTAYTNNIGAYFDNHFCRAIYTLLQLPKKSILD